MKKSLFSLTSNLKQLLLLPVLLIITQSTQAQTFQTDHLSRYQIMGEKMRNEAIHKDDGNTIYYLAQTIRDQHWALLISEVDPDFNIINTYRYDCMDFMTGSVDQNMTLLPKDINFFDDQIIVVGRYIHEGVDDGGFMFSADRNSGGFMWFMKYPDVHVLESVVCNSNLAGSITVGRSEDNTNYQYGITKWAGEIMRMDAAGNVTWRQQVEDNKYVGHPDNWPDMYNQLNHVIQIQSDPDLYATVGSVNNFINWTFPYLDGDATLLTFDENGNIFSQMGLGNTSPVYVNGSTQNNQHETGNSIALCDDGDVIMAGFCIEFPDTTITISCTGSNPDSVGLWLTKVNPTTGAVAWSKLYDMWSGAYSAPDYTQIYEIDIINDGEDNFGVHYKEFRTGTVSVMKVDINGNVIYSRQYSDDYTDPMNDEGLLLDISSGFGTTDIYNVGYIGPINYQSGDGWNIIAFDNIIDYCNSDDLPLTEFEHPYEVYDVEVFSQNTLLSALDFLDRTQDIDLHIDCEKMEADPSDGGKPGRIKNNEPKVSSTVETGDILVETPADKVYTGTLINSLGQKVQSFDNISNTYRISTNDLAPGIYYLHLTSGSEQFARPVLIK